MSASTTLTDDGSGRSGLFREEAVAEQHTKWLGTVLVEDTGFYRNVAIVAALTIVAVILLLVFGSMTRKVPVSGGLMPPQGLARIVAPYQGVVTKLHVKEGEKVRKGAPLATVSAELKTENMADARAAVVDSLKARQASLTTTIGAQRALLEQQGRETSAKLTSLREEKQHLEREIELQKARVDLGRRKVRREIEMRREGLIPLPRLEQTQQEQIEQAGRLQTLERSLTSLKRDILAAEAQVRDLPNRKTTTIGELERTMSGVQQELFEADLRRTMVLTAPSDGTVTALSVELGSSINTTSVLMAVVPEDAVLEAALYSPSSGIGFIKPGQRVKLRIQAFPYQKFGFLEGEVVSVARASTAPVDLPQHLVKTDAPGSTEPAYKIMVKLPSQTVRAYGQEVALRSGMRVDADVMIEKRSLLEWMFEPLIAVTGKWG